MGNDIMIRFASLCLSYKNTKVSENVDTRSPFLCLDKARTEKRDLDLSFAACTCKQLSWTWKLIRVQLLWRWCTHISHCPCTAPHEAMSSIVVRAFCFHNIFHCWRARDKSCSCCQSKSRSSSSEAGPVRAWWWKRASLRHLPLQRTDREGDPSWLWATGRKWTRQLHNFYAQEDQLFTIIIILLLLVLYRNRL